LVEAVHAVVGPHPGHRALHANGVCARGTFAATGAAAPLTTAAHLQPGARVEATVRFSNGSGDPASPDGGRDGRGMSVKFHLLDGSSTDLVGLTLPVFFVRTPEDFLSLMEARIPDPRTGQLDLEKVFAFLAEHPEAQRAVELSLAAPVPSSYTRARYHAIHAFWFVDHHGSRRAVRYRWEPRAGVETVSDEVAGEWPSTHLRSSLSDELAGQPATFDLHVVLAAADDPVDDPTVEWPDDREEIVAGALELWDLVVDQDADCERLIFDPTRVTDGIACTDDPIVHARSAAYSVSFRLRSSASRGG
jgi:catalase